MTDSALVLAEQKTRELQQAVSTNNVDAALRLLNEVKSIIVNFDSLPPLNVEGPTSERERTVARAALELGVLLSAQRDDREAFQRHVASLQPYYTSATYGASVSESPLKSEILGLNLLFLIVENRMGAFHSEIEVLTEAQRQHPFAAFCSRLDQLLMIGAYDQVLAAATNPPCASFGSFLAKLLLTVRDNVAECAAAAYKTLSLQGAQDILMFNTVEETRAFIEESCPEWEVTEAGVVRLAATAASGEQGRRIGQLHAEKAISQTLAYASELERIV